MNHTEHILAEYEEDKAPKSKLYIPVLILMVLFTITAIFTTLFSLYDFSWIGHMLTGLTILISIVVPVAGLLLLLLIPNAGWFISTAYYSFAVIIILSGIINALESGAFDFSLVVIIQIILITLAITLCILLLNSSMRKQFNIRPTVMAGALALGIFLAFTLITS